MTLLQKFVAATPAQTKKAQVICLALAAITLKIATYHIIPEYITNDTFAALTAVSVFAQFFTTDVAMIEDAFKSPLTALSDIPQVLSQVSAIQTSVAAPKPAAPTVSEIITQVEQINQPPVVANGAPQI